MGESNWGVAESETPVDPPPTEDERPRLRLHHLFVLTAVMAVLLAINGPQRGLSGAKFEPPPVLRTWWQLIGISHTILSAAALTAVGYGFIGYRRGLRFFDQPGHWLLVELSLTALLYVVPSVGYRWIGTSPTTGAGGADMALVIILAGYVVLFIALGRLVINTYFGITKCNQPRWRVVFFAKALGSVMLGLGGLVIIPTTLYAWRRDHVERTPRDAGHWCGVALQLALSLLTLTSGVTVVCSMLSFMRR